MWVRRPGAAVSTVCVNSPLKCKFALSCTLFTDPSNRSFFFPLLSRWLRLKSRNYSEALIRSVLPSLQEPCSPHSRWLHAGSGLRRLSEQRKAKEKRKFRARLQKPSRQQESARCFVIHRRSVCRFPSLFSCGRRRDLVENRSKH